MGRNTQDGLPGPGEFISIHCVEDTRYSHDWSCPLQRRSIPGALELSLLHMTSGPPPWSIFAGKLNYGNKVRSGSYRYF